MCTLIVLHRCVPDKPLVVAANRDEFLDRPAEEPALRSSKAGPIVAPLDLEAGGTWVGVNARGVFAGLTNLRSEADGDDDDADDDDGRGDEDEDEDDEGADGGSEIGSEIEAVGGAKPALKSRGEVVMMALEAESAADAIRTLSKLERHRYNPFQLLVADGQDAWLLVYRGSPRAVPLEAGVHIVGNVVDERIEAELGAGSTDSTEIETSPAKRADQEPRIRKLKRIRARVEKLMTEPGQDYFEGLARICREHVVIEGNEGSEIRSPFESTCVHVANRYGTRSSLLLEISNDPTAHRLWTTNGPPCERPFENRSFLLRELGLRLSDRAGLN